MMWQSLHMNTHNTSTRVDLELSQLPQASSLSEKPLVTTFSSLAVTDNLRVLFENTLPLINIDTISNPISHDTFQITHSRMANYLGTSGRQSFGFFTAADCPGMECVGLKCTNK